MSNKDNSSSNNSDFFLLKMIRGDYGLFQTFWFFSFIPSFIFNIFLTIFKNKLSEDITLFLLLIFSLYGVLTFIGIWKSANEYLGNRAWAFLSKASVILGSLTLIITLVSLLGLYSYNDTKKAIPQNLENEITDTQSDLKYDNELFVIFFGTNVQIDDEYTTIKFDKKQQGFLFTIETDKRSIVKNEKDIYFDRDKKTLFWSKTQEVKLEDILKKQYLPRKNTEKIIIVLSSNEIYESYSLHLHEILLISLAPEYIKDINFYGRAKKTF
ncbi:MAG: hypothetical protein Q7J24_15065 [Desulfomicrobium sp.]|nr:hypothetical protein [Desulfomicrobium sp.]